ncbi:MAG: hypothetical protein AAB089_04510 [Nitrospirota bacterium]
MGIVHKLKPEVLNFILENKQKDPALSCRILTQLIFEKLQVKVSKSSINAIFKEHNLSMPIGRRQKHKKKKFTMPALPMIEWTKAVTVVPEPKKEEILPEPKKEEISAEEKRIKEAEEWAMKLREDEQARIKEKLRLEKQKQEEDAHKKSEETEVKALLEEAARVKAKEEERQRELEKIAQEAAEKKHLEEQAVEKKRLEEEAAKIRVEQEKMAKLAEEETKAATEKKRLEEAAKKAEEEKFAEEAALKAEKEKWVRLAEEEHKAKQQKAEEIILPKDEPARVSALPAGSGYPGAVLLKALDCLIGGSKEINEAICREMGVLPENSLSLTEAVIFRPIFGQDNLELLWKLIGRQYRPEELDNHYAQAKQLKNLKASIPNIFTAIFTEARGVKLHFTDASVINLDAQLHSTWNTQNIPFDFSSPVYELKII